MALRVSNQRLRRQDLMCEFSQMSKERGQDYKGYVEKHQFSAPLNKPEPRLTSVQVRYHRVV